ncbi:hypothetical protein [Paracoccus sp. MC1862]|uniref:hypothetical protein n=1 Tax=Paracoccus sp. MC1862 TaxID=2760307 RepID=UPI001C71A8C9|nr:hypothetical protein [Paracoccus sp. MC1862]
MTDDPPSSRRNGERADRSNQARQGKHLGNQAEEERQTRGKTPLNKPPRPLAL